MKNDGTVMMEPNNRRIPFLMILVMVAYLGTLYLASASEPHRRKLDPRIKAVKPGQNRGKDYNPFITIHDKDMTISYGKPQKNKKIKVEELESFLLALPVSAWPSGRMVSLMKCGIKSGSKQVENYRERTWVEINIILKRLEIEPNYWPSA